MAFFQLCADINEGPISESRVLEIGSYDVNGSVRGLFRNAREYVGVDLVHGPGVDLVGFIHELDLGEGSFDIVVSGECFEHDPHWRETFKSMVAHARPGGFVAITCASRGRVEHGTARSGAAQSPGTEHMGSNYYGNVEPDEMDGIAGTLGLKAFRSWYLRSPADLYFAGIKSGGSHPFRLPSSEDVVRIRDLMPLRERIYRYPLNWAARLPISEGAFQRFAIPYWRFVQEFRNFLSRLETRFIKNTLR
ncbi:class I SAM-dependent methyltransferase [Terrabacter sp. LjRoot27]|uniref:class I SAM-dependent methyltransferase n=1 Tax=Terrabacter sp. LjRoot27 TaxID=3342306 RepID=UPI003F4FA01C